MVFTEIIVLLMSNVQADDFYGMIHYTGAAGVWVLRSWGGTADVAAVLKARKQIKKGRPNYSPRSLSWFMLSNPYLVKQSCSEDRGGKRWELNVPHWGLTNHIAEKLSNCWASLLGSASTQQSRLQDWTDGVAADVNVKTRSWPLTCQTHTHTSVLLTLWGLSLN